MTKTDRLSRRQVLGTGMGAAAAILAGAGGLQAARAQSAGQSPSTPAAQKDDLRCGMIGTGGRGSGVLSAIHKSPGVRVTALCDLHEGRLNEAAKAVGDDKPQLFTDYRKLIDYQELDAVFVETPCYLHAEMVIAVLKSGRHCYGEKPMALTVPDINEVFGTAKSSKGIYQVGTQLRYASPWKPAIETIQQGVIGKPIIIQGHRHNAGDMPHDRPWFFDRKLSGDVIVEQAVHEFDIFNAVFQHAPKRASGFGGQAVRFEPKGRNIMDHFTLSLDYGKNESAGYTHSWIAPEGAGGWRFMVYGEKGAVEIQDGKVYLKGKDKPEKVSEEPKGDSTQLAVDDFFRCIREGKQPLANAETGRNAVLVALLGRTAIYEGRLVTMDELLAKG